MISYSYFLQDRQYKCIGSLFTLTSAKLASKHSDKSRYCSENVIIMWKMMCKSPHSPSSSSTLQPTQMPPSISLHCWQAKATLALLISLHSPLCVLACVCVCMCARVCLPICVWAPICRLPHIPASPAPQATRPAATAHIQHPHPFLKPAKGRLSCIN